MPSNLDPKRRGAVAVIVDGDKLLMIRRSQQVVAPGAFCFPGGGIDCSETEEQALVRELQEELGVIVRPLRRLWQSTTPWGVELAWWHAELDGAALLAPNAAEVESVHWVPLGEIAALENLLESNRDFLAALGEGRFELDLGQDR